MRGPGVDQDPHRSKVDVAVAERRSGSRHVGECPGYPHQIGCLSARQSAAVLQPRRRREVTIDLVGATGGKGAQQFEPVRLESGQVAGDLDQFVSQFISGEFIGVDQPQLVYHRPQCAHQPNISQGYDTSSYRKGGCTQFQFLLVLG